MSTAMTMAEASVRTAARAVEAIDREHLSRMTLGERSLERDVLALFERQAAMLLRRMIESECGVVACAAHTLKGSAQGIGAWRVAAAAEAVEQADAAAQRAAIEALADAIDEACAAIRRMLQSH